MMIDFVAERKLLYSLKGDEKREECIIRLGFPQKINQEDVSFDIGHGCWVCSLELIGIDEPTQNIYGADSLQAINLASNIEAYLKRLQKKYDLFWSSGEPYFEQIGTI